MKKNNSLNKDFREFTRFFFGNTIEATFDKSGRVVIPKNLLLQSAIEKDIYLIGVGEKLEIWPKDRYEKQQEKFQDDDEIEKLQIKLFESGVEL